MQWVLPGGARLGGGGHGRDELEMACRPGAAVVVRMKRQPPQGSLQRVIGWLRERFSDEKWLGKVKLVLQILAVLVGLVGAILALFGVLRK
jgi:hypothetical protein